MPRVSAKFLALLPLVALTVLMPGCPSTTNNGPEAAFTASVYQGTAPLTVQFTDTSQPGAGPIQAWAWDFGNGQTSTHRNAVATYVKTGSYAVSLTVTSAYGTNTRTEQNFIVVTEDTSFGGVDAEGGSVSLKGVTVNVEAGAFSREVVFGVKENSNGISLNMFETMQVVSQAFIITHNNTTDRMYGSELGDAVQPATLRLPFSLESIPFSNGLRDLSKLQLLAQLENGLTIPILGHVEGSEFVAPVMRMPSTATYAVVYRPESYQTPVDIPAVAKAPTSYAWKQRWTMDLSPAMLRELTALRLGELRNPASYAESDFTAEQLSATEDKISAGIELLQKSYSESGQRSPALVNEHDTYTLVFFNMNNSSSPVYSSFQELTYRTHLFGSIVIDPMMLLNIATHNAAGLQTAPSKLDPGQVISFANAFAQEVFDASVDGYDYPAILDDADVNLLKGLTAGVSTYFGQSAGWIDDHQIPDAVNLYLHFAQLDMNHNGGLTLSEAQVGVPGLTQAAFNALDADRDGQLLRLELQNSVSDTEAAEAKLLVELIVHFATLDTNADNGLTLAEARVQSSTLSSAEFNDLDVSGDGKLQRFELRPRARGLESNEYALLSDVLFASSDTTLKGYAAANQEFFFYTQYAHAQDDALGYILSHEPLSRGILDKVRESLATELESGQELAYADAVPIVAKAADAALQSNLGVSLAEAYWDFVRDRGVANTPLAALRPSDLSRDLYTLNTDRFASDAIVTEPLLVATDHASITSGGYSALSDIPPLSSRAVVLLVNPLTHDLTLTFNPADWQADDLGNSIAVSVFRQGYPDDQLSIDGTDTDGDGLNDTMVVEGFTVDAETCTSTVILLISNLNLDTANSVDVDAVAFAGMPVADTQVLDTYVKACDPSYGYSLEGTDTVASTGITTYLLKMTSGSWRGSDEVYKPLWQHYISIIEPPVLSSTTGLLMVSGGSTGSLPSSDFAQLMVPFSVATGTVVALIQAVPNEPQQFTDESFTRSEDAIIAHSYDKYMTGYADGKPDMTWPALLPMTRAAVRAMDTIQLFMGEDKPGTPVPVEHFVVTGASKRGWTTWLTAAADSRVTAIMPIVIDVLSMDNQMKHQYKAYGGTYSDAVQDYVDANVFDRFDQPEGASLLKIVDPYSYRTRLTMPKFMINSTGDQFFLPDSSRFFLYNANASANVPGKNYEYFAPNTDHSLFSSTSNSVDSGAYYSMLAFYDAFVRGATLPSFTWAVSGNKITLQTSTTPTSVTLWQAQNRSLRDFRLETIGASWTSTALCPICNGESVCSSAEGEGEGEGETCDSGTYVGQVDIPADGEGWVAFFIQATFPGPDASLDGVDYGFCSRVVVLPDTYPSSSR